MIGDPKAILILTVATSMMTDMPDILVLREVRLTLPCSVTILSGV